jgi:autotransporter-associated beta strand protein
MKCLAVTVVLALSAITAHSSISFSRSDIPTGPQGSQAVTADFNNDGKPDLVALSQVGSISVLLGNGNGTFRTLAPYSVPAGSSCLAAGDVNGDGRLDLVVGGDTSGTVSVLLGNGDGTFRTVATYSSSGGAASVAISDLNNDGKPDLAVANDHAELVSVFMGKGDGTFQARLDFPAPHGRVVTADFNHDGYLDLAVVDANGNDISVLLGDGTGNFGPSVPYPTGNGPADLAIGDFNGDGILDLAAANTYSGSVSILLGNGDGTFQAHKDFPCVGLAIWLAVGDFDGDGKLDIAVSNYTYESVSVLLGNGDGTLQPHVDFSTGNFAETVVAADFNRDGKLDLATANYIDGSVSVLLQTAGVSPFLSFPLMNRTASTAKINTVFDHSSKYQYCADGTVTAYDGEMGSKRPSFVTSYPCGLTKTQNKLFGFKQSSGKAFSLNGQYDGGGDTFHLFYDGHPGYDYKTTDQAANGQIPVLAAASGTVVCVNIDTQLKAPCTEGPGEIKIDHGNGYFTIYLHLSSSLVTARNTISSQQQIGVSGDTGVPGNPHLHFEVRQRVTGSTCLVSKCFPVDPYGWAGTGTDPYTRAPNVYLWQ